MLIDTLDLNTLVSKNHHEMEIIYIDHDFVLSSKRGSYYLNFKDNTDFFQYFRISNRISTLFKALAGITGKIFSTRR